MSNKFNAKKVVCDGITFDSRKEAKRYQELSKDPAVTCLEIQKKYNLIPKQLRCDGKVAERACDYIADFSYIKDGKRIVEDVKGYRRGGAYSVFVIKRKLMLYVHGIEVVEV